MVQEYVLESSILHTTSPNMIVHGPQWHDQLIDYLHKYFRFMTLNLNARRRYPINTLQLQKSCIEMHK